MENLFGMVVQTACPTAVNPRLLGPRAFVDLPEDLRMKFWPDVGQRLIDTSWAHYLTLTDEIKNCIGRVRKAELRKEFQELDDVRKRLWETGKEWEKRRAEWMEKYGNTNGKPFLGSCG